MEEKTKPLRKNWDYDIGDWQEKVKKKRKIAIAEADEPMKDYELRIFGDEEASYAEIENIINWLNDYFENVLGRDINLVLSGKPYETDSEGEIYTARFTCFLPIETLNKIFETTFRQYDFEVIPK
jgi:hypothetical protein